MRQLDFIVVGMPRSGTRFASHLFIELGLRCGHEWVFDAPRPPLKTALYSLFNPRLGSATADASWLAAPYLTELAPQAKILHQVRNPIKVIRSLMGIGFFQRGGKDRLRGYTEFATEYLPPLPDDPLQSCMAFWIHWNRLILKNGANHDYVSYRLEDMTDQDETTLEQVARRVDGLTAPRLARAIAHFPTDVNRRQRDHSISWSSMPDGSLKDQLLQQSIELG